MDSVVFQTLQDIEILCVDAGSTDGTWEILEGYAQKDDRIRLIRSDKKSYGYQINLGLKLAVGEYIGIVETDDYIMPQMYEALYTYAKENDADFVKSDFDIFTSVSDEERLYLRYSLKRYSRVRYRTLFTSMDYIDSKQTVDIFVWNGIYKKNFIEKNHILFQETPGAAFQDCGFRYQVALSVKRGFFLDSSYYRYRRDNAGSSTYNSKCVLFNLAECKNLIMLASKRAVSKEQMSFLAREIAVIALCPYTELITWGTPAEETENALEEFRKILKDFMDRRILTRETVAPEMWLDIRMFVEQPELYDYYVHLKAGIAAESLQDFLKTVATKKEVVLFGSGYIGSCVYCLLRNNGIQNVYAFSDNDSKKWDTMHMGCRIESPEKVVRHFPQAYYIITAGAYSEEIITQLQGYGIPKVQIMEYRLTTSPMDCTNMVMRNSSNNL